jgi:putative ubiquitin-RnfH superfamily antitoxin RatB of RatAB toxin-antitoxin module
MSAELAQAARRGGTLMDIEKLDINAVCFGILCNFTPVCGEERAKEAVELVRTLQAENASLRKERDAAVEDVLDAAITPCSYCKHGPINGGICDMDNDNHEMFSCWEWRGPEEESK